jgi:type II secretory ATPase GspE/PulE/Tfp pilus assembly ATPase PilB-like protein
LRIRDAETMRTVISAAETGHLIIGTMHASTVYQALDRILTQAGADSRLMSQMLANNLLCVLAQNLIPARDSTEENPRRVLCYEALFHNKGLAQQLFQNKGSPRKDQRPRRAKRGHLMEYVSGAACRARSNPSGRRRSIAQPRIELIPEMNTSSAITSGQGSLTNDNLTLILQDSPMPRLRSGSEQP